MNIFSAELFDVVEDLAKALEIPTERVRIRLQDSRVLVLNEDEDVVDDMSIAQARRLGEVASRDREGNRAARERAVELREERRERFRDVADERGWTDRGWTREG